MWGAHRPRRQGFVASWLAVPNSRRRSICSTPRSSRVFVPNASLTTRSQSARVELQRERHPSLQRLSRLRPFGIDEYESAHRSTGEVHWDATFAAKRRLVNGGI